MHLKRIIAPWSIRKKLTLLILAVFVPAAGIIVFQSMVERKKALDDAAHYAATMVDSLAAQQERMAEGTKQLLSTLAQLPQVQDLDADACNHLLRALRDRNPMYSEMGLSRPDGTMIAKADTSEPGSINMSDLKHVRDAIESHDFCVAECMKGGLPGIPALYFAHPVLNSDKRLLAVLTAGFKLTAYGGFIKQVNLPQGWVVVIFDHNSLRLYRYPQNVASRLGLPPKAAFTGMAGLDEGTYERKSDDGRNRLFAFKRLRLTKSSPPYMLIEVGVPKNSILRKANSAMMFNLSFFALTAGIFLSIVWFLGDIAFTRPINMLVDAANRFAGGDMSARTGLAHTPDELGKLAQSFDNMTESLQQKELEKEQAKLELLSVHRHIQLLLNTAQEGIVGLDEKGRVTFANAAARGMLGYEEGELIGRNFHLTVHHSFPDGSPYPETECPMSRSLRGDASCKVRNEFLWKKDGTGFPAAYTTASIMEDERVIGAVLTFRDISERRLAEEALRESERKFKSFSEYAISGIYLIQDGIFKYVNPRFAEMFGYTVEELQDVMPFKHLVYAEDLAKVEGQVERRISGQAESVQYTFRGLRKNGQVFPVEIYGSGTFHNGKPAALGIILDITERRRTEEVARIRLALFEFSASHSLEELLQKILDEVGAVTNSPIGFCHFVDSDQKTLLLKAWSTRTEKEFCRAEGPGMHYPVDRAGVWGDCIHERRPVIHNDYQALPHRKGLPEGHAEVIRELVVPIMRSDRIVAVLGIGNKPENYTEKDVETVSFLADVAWEMVERKKAEEALRISEERYDTLFEDASLGIFRFTPEGRIIQVNPAYVRMFGFNSPEEMQSQVKATDHYVDSSRQDEIMHMLLDSNAPVHAENLYKRKDGSVFTGNLHVWFAHDRDGKPLFIEGFVEDITERKRAEEALQSALRDAMQRSNEVSALLDGAQAVIRHKSFESAARAIFDACKKLVGATSGYVAMLTPDGKENDVLFLDAGGSSCTVDPALPMPVRGLREEAYSRGEPVFDNDFPLSRFQKFMPEGHVFLECVLFAPMVVDGKPVGVIGLANKPGGFNENDARMATALGKLCSIALQNNKSFDALKQSEERLDLAIRSANMGVWSWNINENKRYFDRHVFNLLGINPSTFSGDAEEFFRVVHPDDHETVRAALRRALDEDDWCGTEYRAIRQDGSVRRIITRGKLNRDETGRPIELNGVLWDATEQKNAEEEREKLHAQLRQAQKMESVGRLAGGVAHDFNNMLGVILGHAEMAIEQVDTTHPLHADLQEIRKAALRSADLTRQLLAFARKQTIAPRVLDLNETVEGMLKMLRRLIGEHIDLAWLPDNNLWQVKVDPSQIDQLLANLCVNARDAISGVGKVTIETGAAFFDDNYCTRHPGFVPGEFVMLAVSDNGCGMTRETLDNIFEPFFTTKGVGEGTGLGLATVYGIVKQNNGFINVYSEPGRGTTFKIYLPRAEVQTTEKPSVYLKKNLRGRETVLLVEDEGPMLALGKTILQRHGYEVLATQSPAEALEIVQSYPGPIHLLITDVVMPDMNGKDLRARLVEVKPGLKSIFMSGYTANVIAHHGILDRNIDFLQKPFSVQALLEKVRDVLDG